jgi:GTP-binding protein
MFGEPSESGLHEQIVAHGRKALTGADLVVVVVDARAGLLPGDFDVARAARLTRVPVLVAVNKVDGDLPGRGAQFVRLGFERVLEISAEHGTGVADLLDELAALLGPDRARVGVGSRHRPAAAPDGAAGPEAPRPPGPPEEIRVAIVGRPNVGKSSLLNRLLGEDRAIVSERPGTTRDVVDSELTWDGRRLRILDTAGLRRPGRTGAGGSPEAASVAVARRAMSGSDVAIVVLDAVEGATDQDVAIAGQAEDAGCGVIIAANKWDLVAKRSPSFTRSFDEKTRRRLKFLGYAPLVHTSARTGARVRRLLELTVQVAAARLQRVPTGELNRFVERVTAAHPPSSPTRRDVRILYATQAGVRPPTFVLFTNVPARLHFSYERFLVNRLRDTFGFVGTPIRIQVRRRRASGRP